MNEKMYCRFVDMNGVSHMIFLQVSLSHLLKQLDISLEDQQQVRLMKEILFDFFGEI